MSDILIFRILSTIVVLLSLWRLNARYVARRYLTFSSGLHLNVLLTLGLGPFLYTFPFASLEGERVAKDVIMSSAVPSFFWFTVAYAIVCVFENAARFRRAMFWRFPFNHSEMTPAQFLMLILVVFTGVVGAGFGLSTSGAGTIFIIFYLLFYPMIILSVLKVSPTQAISMLFCLCLLGATFALVFVSPWRSQLILWVLAVLIGVVYRFRVRRRYLVLAGLGFSLFLFLVSPFLQYKKVRSGESDFSVARSLIEAQRIPVGERFEQSYGFLAARVNAAREFGFVNNGVAARLTELRRGETYVNMILQVIPRVVWPSKPSFNQISGYFIAREILLLGWEDEWTSAALTLWPEATINFGPAFLIIFVPMVFAFAIIVDIYSRSLIREGAGSWLLDCVLFFIAFTLVSVVQLSTILVWTFLFVWGFSRLVFSRNNLMPEVARGLASPKGRTRNQIRR